MPVTLFATIQPHPEHRNAVENALREMVRHTRAEPGNLRYDLFLREGEVLAFELFELYVDAAALETHRQSPHYQVYRAATSEWLAAPTQVHIAHPLDLAPFN